MRMLLFAVAAVLVFGGQHVFVYRRLVRDTKLPKRWRRIFAWTLLALFALMFAAMALRRVLPVDYARALSVPVFIWMGLLFLLLFGLLAVDLARLMRWLARKARKRSPVHDPERRLFFSRSAATAVTTTGVIAGAAGVGWALLKTVNREVEVTLKKLPKALDGLKIVQISDLHIGPILGRSWLTRIVEQVNALRPDLIAITGDSVDGSVANLADEVAPLADLRAKYGVFFCTGNHEYYSGAAEWCAHYPKIGIRVLRNEHVPIAPGLDIAGIDDHRSRGMLPGHGPDVDKACHGRNPDHALVLLAHQPKSVFDAARLGVDLQLSGHTHGGQIWPFHYLVHLSQPYLSGLSSHGDTQIYVNSGTGFWGPPMRIGSTSEITSIILRTPKRS